MEMLILKRKYLISIVIALLLLVGCSNDNGSSKEGDNANGSDFPTSNIEIVVPWSAGGSSDLTARALSEAMSELVDKSVVVVNREGAGGTIATTEFANQQPDAHKILFNA